MEEGKPEEGSGRTNDTLQSAKEVEEWKVAIRLTGGDINSWNSVENLSDPARIVTAPLN